MPPYASPWVQVFLLDDHDIVRRGVRDLLVAAKDIHVVGESSTTQGAADAIVRLGATVMVLDVQLQDGTGIEVCRQVRAVAPSVRGLLLTSMDEDEAMAAAVLAGAAGYIVKASHGADLIGAVRRLGQGRSLIDPAMAERVTGQLRSQLASSGLSDEQQHLLNDVLDGLTDGEIAERRGSELEETSAAVASLVDRFTSASPKHRRA
jgi:two-component system, NarL family, response regulator DevR